MNISYKYAHHKQFGAHQGVAHVFTGTTWHSAGLVWRLRPSDIDTMVIKHTLDLVKPGGEIEQLTGQE